MTAQALEQIADEFIGTQSIKTYETIDVYASGVDALYTPPIVPMADLYGITPAWEPAGNLGFGGPGVARVVAPGLVERFRPAHTHEPFGTHTHTEYHSIFNEPYTKPVIKKHNLW